MENIIDNNIPFLTRFFRAWANELELPDIKQFDKMGGKADATPPKNR